jgi:hypothetical protein
MISGDLVRLALDDKPITREALHIMGGWDYDKMIYTRGDAPIEIDFADDAKWPGVPYLDNRCEPLDLPGLTTMGKLTDFINAFRQPDKQVPA